MRSARPSRRKPGAGEQRRVGDALLELAQPRLDVAAHRHDGEIGPQVQHLGLAPQRGGADHRALRQLRERGGLGADEGIAHVLARQQAGDRQARRQQRRHVLHGMHGEVDLAGQQRLLDLLGEQALAAGLGERPVLDAVARWS